MDKPILIGIHGVKRAGKDTTANFIEEWAARQVPALSTCRRGFADKVKLAFARQFFPDITMERAIAWCDEHKLSESAHFRGCDKQGDFMPPTQFRDAMRQFSTEGARDVYGFDFWVDMLLPLNILESDPVHVPVWQRNFEGRYHDGTIRPQKVYLADICMITDLRFENELHRIKKLGGLCWKVRRKEAEEAVIAEAKAAGKPVHRSELGLHDCLFDEVLNNDDNDLVLARHRTEIALNMLTLREDLNELQS